MIQIKWDYQKGEWGAAARHTHTRAHIGNHWWKRVTQRRAIPSSTLPTSIRFSSSSSSFSPRLEYLFTSAASVWLRHDDRLDMHSESSRRRKVSNARMQCRKTAEKGVAREITQRIHLVYIRRKRKWKERRRKQRSWIIVSTAATMLETRGMFLSSIRRFGEWWIPLREG